MGGLLDGVRILEVAQFWMVPCGSAILADLGADVVKIEDPARGDGARGVITYGGFLQSTINYMWEQPNRGKRSVGLDIRTPAGLAVLHRIAATADVFLTNFLPPARRKLHIELEDMRAVNPDIIYVRGHGQGSRGPDADGGAYDQTAFWARSGIADRLTPPGESEPTSMRGAFGDGTTGLAIAGAILGGLFARERTGKAPVADVSLLSAGMWVLAPDLCAAAIDPLGLPRRDRRDAANPLSNSYRTKDGRWLLMSLLQADLHWKQLCHLIGRPDLEDDPRFREMSVRNAHTDECRAELDGVFSARTLAEWETILADFAGPWQVYQTPAEVLQDPQVLANGYAPSVTYGHESTRLIAGPIQYNETAPELHAAPELGQHTEECLIDLGYSWDELAELKAAKVIS